jgi:plasmid stabilization system protein ParE
MAALDCYVIFFRILDNTVRIVRVLHGARTLPALLASKK